MNNYTYTFIAIAVYLGTVAITYYTLHKRFTDTLSRACTSFTDAMTAISKALDTEPEPEPEPTNERQTE